MNGTSSNEPSGVKLLVQDLAERVQGAQHQAKATLQIHQALAKAEVKQNITVPLSGGLVMLVVAGILALDALMLLFVTAAWGIHRAGVPPWGAFGIVTLVVFVITGILAMVGVKKLKQVKAPEHTIGAAKSLVDDLKSAVQPKGDL